MTQTSLCRIQTCKQTKQEKKTPLGVAIGFFERVTFFGAMHDTSHAIDLKQYTAFGIDRQVAHHQISSDYVTRLDQGGFQHCRVFE